MVGARYGRSCIQVARDIAAGEAMKTDICCLGPSLLCRAKFPSKCSGDLAFKVSSRSAEVSSSSTEQWVGGEMERGVLDLFYCLMEEQD